MLLFAVLLVQEGSADIWHAVGVEDGRSYLRGVMEQCFLSDHKRMQQSLCSLLPLAVCVNYLLAIQDPFDQRS